MAKLTRYWTLRGGRSSGAEQAGGRARLYGSRRKSSHLAQAAERDATGYVLVSTETERQNVDAAIAAFLKLKADHPEMLALQNKVIATSVALDLGNGETMEFVYVPPGDFKMGNDNVPVSVKQGFNIGKYTVTVGQFKRFVQETRHKTHAELKGSASGYSWAPSGVNGKTWTAFPSAILDSNFTNRLIKIPLCRLRPRFGSICQMAWRQNDDKFEITYRN